MKIHLLSIAVILFFGAQLLAQETKRAAVESEEDIYVLNSTWQPLLSKNLDQWEVYTGVPHKSIQIPGFEKSTSENCRGGKAYGLGDPMNIFSLEGTDKQPILKITGKVYAGLTTLETFSDYHLTLEYKWGEKKWAPRENALRDSGVLIHCVGEHGSFWNVWMSSLECQVQETDTADFIALAGTSATTPIKKEDVAEGMPKFDPEGVRVPVGNGTKQWGAQHLDTDVEIKNDWNRVDIYTLGDKSRFVVNGKLLMLLDDTKMGKQSDGEALTSGKIQIQSEAADVSYRGIRIRKIKELPSFDAK